MGCLTQRFRAIEVVQEWYLRFWCGAVPVPVPVWPEQKHMGGSWRLNVPIAASTAAVEAADGQGNLDTTLSQILALPFKPCSSSWRSSPRPAALCRALGRRPGRNDSGPHRRLQPTAPAPMMAPTPTYTPAPVQVPVILPGCDSNHTPPASGPVSQAQTQHDEPLNGWMR